MRKKVVKVVEDDYLGVIKKKMEAVYTIPIGAQDRGLEKEKREREQRQAFIVSRPPIPYRMKLMMQIYLNDLDISADYMDRLLAETSANLPQVFMDKEMKQVKEELDELNELSNRFRSSSKVSYCARLLR